MAPKPVAAQAVALRELAKKVEKTGKPLPRALASAVSEALEDLEDHAALREWRASKARGEKTIPAAEVRRKLGI